MASPLQSVARELYRLHQEVNRIEILYDAANMDQKEILKEELRKARAERDRIKKVIEGHKKELPYRKAR